MSRIVARFSVLLALCALQPVYATEFQITIQADLTKDEFSTSFFGITDVTVPIQFSFVVEDTDALTLPAGTPMIPTTGAALSGQAYLYNAGSIRDFAASIGNASFSTADLRNMNFGATAYAYDLMLVGTLDNNGLSAAHFWLNPFGGDPAGNLQIGWPICMASCLIGDYGLGESYLENSVANITGIRVNSRALVPPPASVPEPAMLALMLAGLAGMMGLMRRRRPAERLLPAA